MILHYVLSSKKLTTFTGKDGKSSIVQLANEGTNKHCPGIDETC